MDITQMNVTELKALAFDQLRQIELCNRNLAGINQEIARKEQDPVAKAEVVDAKVDEKL